MENEFETTLTVADLETMPEDGNRYELVEGELIVSGAPSLPRQIVVAKLIGKFEIFLADNPLGWVVPGPGIIFSRFDAVIPDVVYYSRERGKEIAVGMHLSGAPELVIEVVSPGTENVNRDRQTKRRVYGKYGVEEYWLADRDHRSIEVYRLQEKKLKRQTKGFTPSWFPRAQPPFYQIPRVSEGKQIHRWEEKTPGAVTFGSRSRHPA